MDDGWSTASALVPLPAATITAAHVGTKGQSGDRNLFCITVTLIPNVCDFVHEIFVSMRDDMGSDLILTTMEWVK